MHATRILSEEHEVILRALDRLESVAGEAERSGALDADAAGDLVFFLRSYADAFHHGKEEALLFPKMVEQGESADDGPIALMCEEHVANRAVVARMDVAVAGAAGGDRDAAAAFARDARDLAGMLREHIDKEESVVFPLANEVLEDDDGWALTEEYARFEEAFDSAVVARCLRIAGA